MSHAFSMKTVGIFLMGGIVGIIVAQSSQIDGGNLMGRLTLGGTLPSRCGAVNASCTNTNLPCCSGLSCQVSPDGSRSCQRLPVPPPPPPLCGGAGAACTNADPQCCFGYACRPLPNGSRVCQETRLGDGAVEAMDTASADASYGDGATDASEGNDRSAAACGPATCPSRTCSACDPSGMMSCTYNSCNAAGTSCVSSLPTPMPCGYSGANPSTIGVGAADYSAGYMAGYTAGYAAGAVGNIGGAPGAAASTAPVVDAAAAAASPVCTYPHQCLHSSCGPGKHEVPGRCGASWMKCCAQNQTSTSASAATSGGVACSNTPVRECLPDSLCPPERTEQGYCGPNTNNDVCCRRACGGGGNGCEQPAFCPDHLEIRQYYCAGGFVCCDR